VQVPGVALQTSHDWLHAVAQQTPSTHEPLTHWLPEVHARPFFSLHSPAALHALLPVQVSCSVPPAAPTTGAHTPPAPGPSQRRHVPHVVSQQKPSRQDPPEQSTSPAHALPNAWYSNTEAMKSNEYVPSCPSPPPHATTRALTGSKPIAIEALL
jgi:hypothetical protein